MCKGSLSEFSSLGKTRPRAAEAMPPAKMSSNGLKTCSPCVAPLWALSEKLLLILKTERWGAQEAGRHSSQAGAVLWSHHPVCRRYGGRPLGRSMLKRCSRCSCGAETLAWDASSAAHSQFFKVVPHTHNWGGIF